MKPRSLRVRLLAGAAVWTVLALLLSGIALVFLFEANIERGAREDLVATRNRLIANVSLGTDATDIATTLTDPLYATPFGGLYWQIENLESGEVLRSRSLWDTVLDFPPVRLMSGPNFVTIDGPEDQRLLALGGVVAVEAADNPVSYIVTVAQDRAAVERAVKQFGLEMTVDLLVLGIALMAAAWVQVNLGMRPLRNLARAIEAIRAGRMDRLDNKYPAEVLPLVHEVNELLSAREKSVNSARARAAELAHSLKTPIAVLSAAAQKLGARGDAEHAAEFESLAREMAQEVDHQLRRARIRPRTSQQVLRTSLNDSLLRTISVLRKTSEGEAVHWQVALSSDAGVDIDEHDLMELLGIVLENAVKWSASRVDVSTAIGEAEVQIMVHDDGPGLTTEQISRIGIRGQQLSKERPGSGFGLAIALEIVDVNRGRVEFGTSDMGGLGVSMTLPKSQ